MPLEVIEAWTGDLDFQLKNDNVAVNLTGTTVVLILQDNNGAAVTLAGTTSTFDAVLGKVRLSPNAADLVAAKSPYNARWKVTDGAGKVVFFPSGTDDVWIVRPQ
jgi:hypothetical protein